MISIPRLLWVNSKWVYPCIELLHGSNDLEICQDKMKCYTGQTTWEIRNGLNLMMLVYKFHCYIEVTRSRGIESDTNYQNNEERVQELKALWKKEKLRYTIDKYVETCDVNTITSLYFRNSHF